MLQYAQIPLNRKQKCGGNDIANIANFRQDGQNPSMRLVGYYLIRMILSA